jgi:peptide/nickel transport system permease protein
MSIVLVSIISMVFLITHLLPLDPARVAVGFAAGPEQIEATRKSLGLDRPLAAQYFNYLSRLARLDLGTSVRTRRPVAEDMKIFLPATLELTGVSMAVEVGLSVPLGVIAAVSRRGRRSTLDQAIRVSSTAGIALPAYWLAIMLQVVFYAMLGLLPVGGRIGTSISPPTHITGLYLVDSLVTLDWVAFVDVSKHLILPVTAMVMGPLPIGIRMVRSSVLAQLSEDYVRTARAKGLGERVVLLRHVLRNGLAPIMTHFGINLGYLIGGAFLVEAVFLWPGIGRYAVTSIQAWDYSAMLGVTFLVSALFVTINFVTDLLYGVVDPRVIFR